MEMGHEIAKLRNQKGLSQKELAQILNISTGVVGFWETNTRFPTMNNFIDLIDYFAISADKLLDNDRKCSPAIYKKDLQLTQAEKDLINTYRLLSSDYKDVLVGKSKELKIQQQLSDTGKKSDSMPAVRAT